MLFLGVLFWEGMGDGIGFVLHGVFLGIGLIPVFRTLNDVVYYESIFLNYYIDAIGTLSCCR